MAPPRTTLVRLLLSLCWFSLASSTATGRHRHLWQRDVALSSQEDSSAYADAATLSPRQSPARRVLECFQVAQPVLGETGPVYQSLQADGTTRTRILSGNEEDVQTAQRAKCTQVLMVHSFGWSYGMPFVGNYTPPDCDFNRVILNFTVTSQGRQFDRLALMYLGDTEVWRTSTAEPRAPPGIRWTYWKDMTQFLYFWKTPQKLIFDLGNLIDDRYTGPFNTTLTAHFFVSDVETDAAPPADLIIPISARNGSASAISAWNVPDQPAINVINTFPRNVRRAVFSVSANGQIGEEFWWANVPESTTQTFAKLPGGQEGGKLPGLAPFREIQVWVDGMLAGVQWPFPVIFTGGISPTFHRPIVGLDAFDLREHEIDITAFLPLLCDGQSHTFEIKIGGINDNSTEPFVTDRPNSYWVVTGKIFVWLDEPGRITTGSVLSATVPAPTIQIISNTTQTRDGFNVSLFYDVDVRRSISISSNVTTSEGTKVASWTQNLWLHNVGYSVNFGNDGNNTMNLTGIDVADGGWGTYSSAYSYPLYVNSSYREDRTGAFSITAELNQGLDLEVMGAAVYPTGLEAFAALARTERARFAASKLTTHRNGSAYFWQSGDGRSGSATGKTSQAFQFGGVSKEGMLGDRPEIVLYERSVTAENDEVVRDRERLADVEAPEFVATQDVAAAPLQDAFAPLPGRGSPEAGAGQGGGVFAAAGRDARNQVAEGFAGP